MVEDASEAEERFAPGARVWVGGEPARVVDSKRAGGRRVVKLDRPAERGEALELPRAELPPPEEGSYYVVDLLGLNVREEGGRTLGRVAGVAPGVANDVLELDSGLSLPMAETCIRRIDAAAGTIIVFPGFADD